MFVAMTTRKRVIVILLVFGAALQAVPYGRRHTNPPAVAEPPWDSPRTRELFLRVCADCHSNGTKWPWYSHVAPASWLVQHDVEEARRKLNISEWGVTAQKRAADAADEVREDDMPPLEYKMLHPAARLSDAERQEFVRGLAATFGERRTSGAESSKEHDSDDN
jgi:mono/diheme cytochrome c family protein